MRPEGLLGTLPLFNIVVRSVPFNDLSRSVPPGTGTEEKPAKFAVETAQARFNLTGFPRSQQAPPIVDEPGPVSCGTRNGPAPIRRLFRREAGIIQPAPVEEFGRAVGTGRPGQRRNRVNDGSQSIFRVLDFDQSVLEGSVRSLELDRNERNVAGLVDQLEISTVRSPWLRIGHAEGAKNLAVLRNEWFGPGRAEPMGQSQVSSFIGPSRIAGNIRNDHSLFRIRGGAARTP